MQIISHKIPLPESIMETCSVVLTFESVNEILWCDHSNETSLAVRLHGTNCFSIFYKKKFGIFFNYVAFGIPGGKMVNKQWFVCRNQDTLLRRFVKFVLQLLDLIQDMLMFLQQLGILSDILLTYVLQFLKNRNQRGRVTILNWN